jgi:hypothetical protein
MPLSDADIFKAQFYKYYKSKGQKDDFITRWRALEDICGKYFRPIYGTPTDELFSRYMYYLRAKQGIKSSTTEALRKFYERDKYVLLNNDYALYELESLAEFWKSVLDQNTDVFSDKVLRRLYVLNYAPNGMWAYFVSVYFMTNKNSDGLLDDESFYVFLNKITAFIWAYAVSNPGVNALRTPIYAEMVNVVEHRDVTFSEWLFDPITLRSQLDNYSFGNNRAITKSMLTWWAFNNDEQPWIDYEVNFEIEHILAKKRIGELNNAKNLELLGNKSLLEKKINIRASDYRFSDKLKYYRGEMFDRRQNKKEPTKIVELLELANSHSDFVESDIINRNDTILAGFIDYLRKNGLVIE